MSFFLIACTDQNRKSIESGLPARLECNTIAVMKHEKIIYVCVSQYRRVEKCVVYYANNEIQTNKGTNVKRTNTQAATQKQMMTNANTLWQTQRASAHMTYGTNEVHVHRRI